MEATKMENDEKRMRIKESEKALPGSTASFAWSVCINTELLT